MEQRYFQWIAGERRGEVVIFDKIVQEDGEVYIQFKDNSRINENLVAELNIFDLSNKMMAEVSDPNNIWKFKEEWVGREEEKWETNGDGEKVCVQPFVPGRKTIKLLHPQKIVKNSKFGNIENTPEQLNNNIKDTNKSQNIIKEVTSETSEGEVKEDLSTKNDPVYIMMEKSKKQDVDIKMTLTISLPSKNLFNVAKESFDDGEEKALNYITENINTENIKNSLKMGIKEMYSSE